MAAYDEIIEENLGINDSYQNIYSEATYKRILEDALTFLSISQDHKISETEQKRFARISILLMAFYLESLSNLLFDFLIDSPIEDYDKRNDLPGPIRKFRAVYSFITQTELELDIEGLRDIFIIRNKIIAHPAGRSEELESEKNRDRRDRKVTYFKFTNFPFTYAQFSTDNAICAWSDVKEFMISFFTLLKDKTQVKKLIDDCWPVEIIEFFNA